MSPASCSTKPNASACPVKYLAWQNWQAKGKDQVSFLYQGDLNALLACLAGGQVRDFSLAEPSLEEIFRHYYQEGGDLS